MEKVFAQWSLTAHEAEAVTIPAFAATLEAKSSAAATTSSPLLLPIASRVDTRLVAQVCASSPALQRGYTCTTGRVFKLLLSLPSQASGNAAQLLTFIARAPTTAPAAAASDLPAASAAASAQAVGSSFSSQSEFLAFVDKLVDEGAFDALVGAMKRVDQPPSAMNAAVACGNLCKTDKALARARELDAFKVMSHWVKERDKARAKA